MKSIALRIKKFFHHETKILKYEQIKGFAKDLAPAYIILFSESFMLFVFEPFLMYATNINDFWFDFKIMVWPVLIMFACFLLLGLLIISAIYFCNLMLSKQLNVYKGFVLFEFVAFFLLYLQGNWLSGNLPSLTGEKIVWSAYGKYENLVLSVVFVILNLVALTSIYISKFDHIIHCASIGSFFIFIVLFVSLIPTMITNDTFKSKDTFTPSIENFNTVSVDNNFLIFLVDTMDLPVFYDVMNKDEDFHGMFEDFTYYPDTLSAFTYTRDSIPSILTGLVNRFETNLLDFSANAYNQSPLLKKLDQNGYTINLYSQESYFQILSRGEQER